MAASTKRVRSEQSEALAAVEIVNPPYTMWKYTDRVLKNDYVCVVVNIFTGCKSVTFDISDDGLKITVRLAWASALHTPEQMFNEALTKKTLSVDSPMLHAMAAALMDSGVTEDSEPVVQMVIALPCKVRREVTSYSMEKLTYETTKMMFIKLMAYQNDVIIDQASNRTMKFD